MGKSHGHPRTDPHRRMERSTTTTFRQSGGALRPQHQARRPSTVSSISVRARHRTPRLARHTVALPGVQHADCRLVGGLRLHGPSHLLPLRQRHGHGQLLPTHSHGQDSRLPIQNHLRMHNSRSRSTGVAARVHKMAHGVLHEVEMEIGNGPDTPGRDRRGTKITTERCHVRHRRAGTAHQPDCERIHSDPFKNNARARDSKPNRRWES